MELLKKYNLPVWVMEPLRGGKLASLAAEDEAKLKALRPQEGIPAWAFRFLQSIPEVTVILSGMSNMEQLEDNITTFEEDKPLNEQEMKTLLDIADRHGEEDRRSLHGLPLLCQPLSPGAGYSPVCWPCTMSTALPEAALSRPWLCRTLPEDKRPSCLHWMPKLRGSLSPADQDFRGDGGFCAADGIGFPRRLRHSRRFAEALPEGFRAIAGAGKTGSSGDLQHREVGLLQQFRALAQPVVDETGDGRLLQIVMENFVAAALAHMSGVGDLLQGDFIIIMNLNKMKHVL